MLLLPVPQVSGLCGQRAGETPAVQNKQTSWPNKMVKQF